LLHTVDPAGADDVEELRGEFGERRADASARHDRRAAAAEEIRQLTHSVEVRLQARQEHKVITCAARGIEWPVPVLMVEPHVKVLLVDERTNMQSRYWLHEVA
jgi:hypothetical protein